MSTMPGTKSKLAPKTWPTRREFGAAANLSYSSIQRRERDGVLVSLPDEDGTMRVDPAQLQAQRAGQGTTAMERPLGERVAAVVELLQRGASDAEIVTELKMTFEDVRVVRREYCLAQNSFVVSPDERGRLESLIAVHAGARAIRTAAPIIEFVEGVAPMRAQIEALTAETRELEARLGAALHAAAAAQEEQAAMAKQVDELVRSLELMTNARDVHLAQVKGAIADACEAQAERDAAVECAAALEGERDAARELVVALSERFEAARAALGPAPAGLGSTSGVARVGCGGLVSE
jgi:hypothetical protein